MSLLPLHEILLKYVNIQVDIDFIEFIKIIM